MVWTVSPGLEVLWPLLKQLIQRSFLSSRTSIWTWHKFALHHFPSKLSTECFCGKILGVMDVFVLCIIKALHGALMTVPEPEPTSLHEEGFAVWMWECVITLYVQCNEREADREAWLRRLPSTLAKAVKLKSFYTFCWVIIISWQTHTLALQKYITPFLLHSFHCPQLPWSVWITQCVLYCVTWQRKKGLWLYQYIQSCSLGNVYIYPRRHQVALRRQRGASRERAQN